MLCSTTTAARLQPRHSSRCTADLLGPHYRVAAALQRCAAAIPLPRPSSSGRGSRAPLASSSFGLRSTSTTRNGNSSTTAPSFSGAAMSVARPRVVTCTVAGPSSPTPPPPAPQPLSELPIPTPADALPPLLQWATSAVMRPVAVQCVLERHCSPEVLEFVRAAALLAAEEGGGDGEAAAVCVTPAHLALAALASSHPDCAAVLGVLHSHGLPLARCPELLMEGLADVEAEVAEVEVVLEAVVELNLGDERVGGIGSSGVGRCSGGGGSGNGSIFSSAAQHFLFQAYRWSLFTDHDCVLPYHLLWALSADPRVGYSRGRTDPLDSGVVAWRAWEPPLVGLLERAGLERPAAAYEQLMGVVQQLVNGNPTHEQPHQKEQQEEEQRRQSEVREEGCTSGCGGGSSSIKNRSLHLSLERRLSQPLPTDFTELCELVATCRAVGMVPSRAQLQAINGAIAAVPTHSVNTGFGPCMCVSKEAPWHLANQLIVGMAGLGFRLSSAACDLVRLAGAQRTPCPPKGTVVIDHRTISAQGPATPCDPTVELACDAALAFQFHVSRMTLMPTWLRTSPHPQHQLQELLLLADVQGAGAPTAATAALEIYDACLSLGTSSWSAGVAILGSLPPGTEVSSSLAVRLASGLPGKPKPGRRQAAAGDGSSSDSSGSGGSGGGSSGGDAGSGSSSGNAISKTGDDGNDGGGNTAAVLLSGLTLRQRVRLLTNLAAAASSAAPQPVPALDAFVAAAANAITVDSASIHASLAVQREVGQALGRAGRPVPEGWLRQLASYGSTTTAGATAAVGTLLAAAAAGAACPKRSRLRLHTAPAGPELLGRLGALLAANASSPHMQPDAALTALMNLHHYAAAVMADGTGVAALEAATTQTLTAAADRGASYSALASSSTAAYSTQAPLDGREQQLAWLGVNVLSAPP